MKRRRLAMALALSAGASLALAACSGSSGGDSETDLDAKQTINVWGWSGAPGAKVMAKVIDGFEKEHPNIKVSYNEVVNTNYENKATLGLSSGQPIDVVAVFPNAMTAQIEKYLVPVKDWPGVDGIVDKFQPQTIEQEKKISSDGVIHEVPLDSNGAAIGYYNVDLLKKAGLTEPPQTWAEMKQLTEGLAKNAPGIVPAIIPADTWFQDDFLMTLVGQTDPDFWNKMIYDDGKWDTPAMRSALKQYQELYANGTLDKSTIDIKYADAMSLFGRNKAAIVFSGTWDSGLLLPSYRETNKVQASDVGAMAVPAVDPADAGLRSFLDTTYGIPVKSSHKAAAAKFIEYLTVGDGVDIWSSALVGIPAVTGWSLPEGVLTTEVEKKGYALIQKLIADPRGDRNDIDAFKNQMGTYALQVASGNLSPEQAAKKGQADWDSGKYN